jgi:hypothetical protein
MHKGAIFFVFFLFLGFTSYAQTDALSKKISLKIKKQTIPEILKIIEETA